VTKQLRQVWLGQVFALLSLACAVFLAPAGAAGQVPEPAGQEPTDGNGAARSAATEAVENQRTLLEYLRNPHWQPVRSLLLEQEMPLVGIRWGAQLQFDIPLNSQPDGAKSTLREARLTFYHAFGNHLYGKVTANYNNAGEFEIGDSYLVYSGWRTIQATAGLFRPPYSLETLSKGGGLTFMERALPVAALSERRSGGMALLKRTPHAILNMGLYLFGPDDQGQSEKGQALVLRYVHAPLDPGHGLKFFNARNIWAGLSASYRVNASGPDTQFRSRPETGITDDYFVDTGPIDGANSIFRMGLEASKVAGSFSWQAELLASKVQRDNASSVLFFGGYAMASWFFTGDTRNYSSATGEFLTVKPNAPVGHGGWGAWEIGLRASTVDLNDIDIVGGRQRDLTLGLNWYLTEQLRVQSKLIKVLDVDRPGSEFDGQDPWIFTLRLQYYLP
jgi:phosphate-selective porin OprO/OprP